MWLLSTDRAELRFFVGPEDTDLQWDGGYAILSHVWDKEETSFQDLQTLIRRCGKTGENPRDHVPEKIRKSCILAERYRLKWIWIDTCCIDKTSSAELSEAINAMFRYYAMSAVCYAFLRDVPANYKAECSSAFDRSEGHPSGWSHWRLQFHQSRWHRRGWTLQELVAPKLVLFVSSDWRILGTKFELAGLLEEITGIQACILRLEKDVADISIAGRMRWARSRETTRPEDEAYSLMGIFGISIPILYGEGRKAFYRLQEEIMRTSADASLFLWGESVCTLDSLRKHPSWQMVRSDGRSHCDIHLKTHSHLMAHSPQDFRIEFSPESDHNRCSETVTDMWAQGLIAVRPTESPSFTLTPHGVLARVPVIDKLETSGRRAVALFYGDAHEAYGLHVERCLDMDNRIRSLYHVYSDSDLHYRIVHLTHQDLSSDCVPVWKDIYLSRIPPFRAGPEIQTLPVTLKYVNASPSSPFQIWDGPVICLEVEPKLEDVSTIPLAEWAGVPPLALLWSFRYPLGEECFVEVVLGVCGKHGGKHWATTRVLGMGGTSPERACLPEEWRQDCAADTHACERDHIELWPRTRGESREREFCVGHVLTYELSFDAAQEDGRTLRMFGPLVKTSAGTVAEEVLPLEGVSEVEIMIDTKNEQGWHSRGADVLVEEDERRRKRRKIE